MSQAVLDLSTATGEEVQLILKSDKVDYILCILRKPQILQVPLDLNFSEGDEISFRTVGGTVHLTGYLTDDPDFADMEEAQSGEEDEEVPMLVPAPKHKSKGRVSKDAEGGDSENSDEEEEEGSDEEEELEDDVEEEEAESEDDQPPPAKVAKTNGMGNGVMKKDKKSKHKKEPVIERKTLQAGVKIEEIRLGQGAMAKPHKKVHVYYEGRFQGRNKIFDKTRTGRGFEFTIGRGDVIKGWDIGVQGMKVGGKRRIICPPETAYGSKGSPPAIPPNSTLVFDVELRSVN